MKHIQKLMARYPFMSILLIFPFTLILILAVFSMIIKIVIPAVLALWLAGWVYGAVVREAWGRNLSEPFWFVRYRNFSR
tara:strand:+ start:122 stop:358 length:237 start_codon:yes stop_codon:yes gene_type:complete